MKKVLVFARDTNVCGHLRVFEPYRNITCDNIEFVIEQNLDESHFADPTIDAVLLQRPDDPNCPYYITKMKENGKIVVTETDDDLKNIPPSNPSFNHYKNVNSIYEECLKLSDYVHTSTPELAYSPKATTFFNAVDLNKYTETRTDFNNTVYWQGSQTHLESLYLIKDAIRELMDKGVKVILQSNLQWLEKLVYDKKEKIFTEHENLELRGYVKFEESYKMFNCADVNLAPLPNTAFNRSKSELRILESAAYGIPTVSSDVAPYRRFYELSGGGNLLVKKERTKNWVESVLSLLNDRELYHEKSKKSLEAVRTIYNLKTVNWQRANWWSKVLNK